MPGFKEQTALDRAVFINTDEFADVHAINGRQMSIVLDKDELKRRQAKPEYGYEGDILFYVDAMAYGEAPVIGQFITFDGDKYRVSDVQEDEGLYLIELVANL